MPAWVDTGTVVVDKNNVAAFREALAAHTSIEFHYDACSLERNVFRQDEYDSYQRLAII